MANIHLESRKRPALWAVPAVLAALGLATWALWPASPSTGSTASPEAQLAGSASAPGTAAVAEAGGTGGNPAGGAPVMPVDAPAARSIGSQFDLDSHGKLLISGKTKDALDTILAAYPKGPNTKDWNTIEDALAKELPKPAVQEALQLLHSAQQLNLAIEQLKNANPNAEAEGRSVEVYAQIKALRRQNFDSRTADLLFADEETWGTVLLGIQAIESNPKLSPEAKKQQTQDLINTLPGDLKVKASQMFSQ